MFKETCCFNCICRCTFIYVYLLCIMFEPRKILGFGEKEAAAKGAFRGSALPAISMPAIQILCLLLLLLLIIIIMLIPRIIILIMIPSSSQCTADRAGAKARAQPRARTSACIFRGHAFSGEASTQDVSERIANLSFYTSRCVRVILAQGPC